MDESRLMPDLEGEEIAEDFLPGLHPLHPGIARTPVAPCDETMASLFIPLDAQMDTPVSLVPHPAFQLKAAGLLAGRITKAHTLDTALNRNLCCNDH